jgi:methionyl-tRNA formyltransferase
LSLVFLGTSDFAAAVLERLAASAGHRPALVVTRPDRRRGRGRKVSSPPVAQRARALGIPVEQPESVNEPHARELIAAAAARAGSEDLQSTSGPRQTVVVCAFGALVKEPLLSEHELLNVHPSLLPRWRGAAPIERAIMAGDSATGVSIMRLTAGLDSGPVCLAASEPTAQDDTYGTLAARLQELGGEVLLEALERKAAGRPLAFIDQDDSKATYAEKIQADDRLLDPARPALEAERRVRALHPHIGARVTLGDGTLLGVQRAELVATRDQPGAASGRGKEGRAPDARGVAVEEGRLILRCTDGALELQVVQPPGGRVMDAAAYVRGHREAPRR